MHYKVRYRDASGRTRNVVHYKVRYRDASGKHHSETKTKLVDAERRKAEIEVALATATWRDPRRGELSLAEWAQSWLPTRFDLRPTTWARLETTMQKLVLPHFGPSSSRGRSSRPRCHPPSHPTGVRAAGPPARDWRFIGWNRGKDAGDG